MNASQTVHLVTGEFPPDRGGVADYTAVLASALAGSGADVHVWSPHAKPAASGSVTVHALPDHFGRGARAVLDGAFARVPGRIILQYVPNALGAHGANIPFSRWFERAGQHADAAVMFHEPYFYFSRHVRRSALAVAQRIMARHLLRAGRVAYLSTSSWVRYLKPYAPAGIEFVAMPIPATVPRSAEPQAVESWRRRLAADGDGPLIGHFGTFGEHVARELRGLLPRIFVKMPSARVVCVGRGSESFVASLGFPGRVAATGELVPADVPAVLRACDLIVQPYPDGVTTRRTTVMAALATGVATLTTDGELTEDIWRSAGALALTPPGDHGALAARAAMILRDPALRADLARRGAELYERHFAIARTVEVLTARRGAAVTA